LRAEERALRVGVDCEREAARSVRRLCMAQTPTVLRFWRTVRVRVSNDEQTDSMACLIAHTHRLGIAVVWASISTHTHTHTRTHGACEGCEGDGSDRVRYTHDRTVAVLQRYLNWLGGSARVNVCVWQTAVRVRATCNASHTYPADYVTWQHWQLVADSSTDRGASRQRQYEKQQCSSRRWPVHCHGCWVGPV
jgi:hypothetical protein